MKHQRKFILQTPQPIANEGEMVYVIAIIPHHELGQADHACLCRFRLVHIFVKTPNLPISALHSTIQMIILVSTSSKERISG